MKAGARVKAGAGRLEAVAKLAERTLEDDTTHCGGQLLLQGGELGGRDRGEVLELGVTALTLDPAQDGATHERGAAHLVRVRGLGSRLGLGLRLGLGSGLGLGVGLGLG